MLARHKIDEKDTVIDEGGHSLEHHEAAAPTCADAGHGEYWSCPLCQKMYLDENGVEKTTPAEVEIAALRHDAEHVDTVRATCQEAGVNEHWKRAAGASRYAVYGNLIFSRCSGVRFSKSSQLRCLKAVS